MPSLLCLDALRLWNRLLNYTKATIQISLMANQRLLLHTNNVTPVVSVALGRHGAAALYIRLELR